jgi:hypothetical protein
MKKINKQNCLAQACRVRHRTEKVLHVDIDAPLAATKRAQKIAK